MIFSKPCIIQYCYFLAFCQSVYHKPESCCCNGCGNGGGRYGGVGGGVRLMVAVVMVLY